MKLGIIILRANILGEISLKELDWITENEHHFSRLDMSLIIKLGRLIDNGIIKINCSEKAYIN